MSARAGTAVDAASPAAVVARSAARLGLATFLVGGAVRDELLGIAPKDVDVAVETDRDGLGKLAAELERTPGWTRRARHERFGTATFDSAHGIRVDLAATRRETYPKPAALPLVTTGVPITQDLGRRDFTIHAMARPLARQGPLLDPHRGAHDLEARTIRLLHERSLADDPTRIFRAARYASRLGFAVAPGFAHALETCRRAAALRALSPDRLRRSLAELLEESSAVEALALLDSWRVLGDIAPGLRPPDAPLPETLAERWSALAAPLSAAARTVLVERLNFSRALRRAVGLK